MARGSRRGFWLSVLLALLVPADTAMGGVLVQIPYQEDYRERVFEYRIRTCDTAWEWTPLDIHYTAPRTRPRAKVQRPGQHLAFIEPPPTLTVQALAENARGRSPVSNTAPRATNLNRVKMLDWEEGQTLWLRWEECGETYEGTAEPLAFRMADDDRIVATAMRRQAAVLADVRSYPIGSAPAADLDLEGVVLVPEPDTLLLLGAGLLGLAYFEWQGRRACRRR